jgi:GcrA cell cycle regulator
MTAIEIIPALSGEPPNIIPSARPAPPPPRRASATWTSERIEQLRLCVSAGLTCAQIAAELGVSRNAVIGKLNRLGLSRGRAPAARRTERVSPPRPLAIASQRQVLRAVYAEPPPAVEAPVVVSLRRCSLLELTHATCRWPVSGDDAPEIYFCGNTAVPGMPYCAGHVRMAYRPPARRHA